MASELNSFWHRLFKINIIGHRGPRPTTFCQDQQLFTLQINVYFFQNPDQETGGCFTLTFHELFKRISQKYTMPEITFIVRISSWNFVPRLCTCAQSMALGTRTKFQLEILIRSTISAKQKFREIILESLRNVSETTPWTSNFFS